MDHTFENAFNIFEKAVEKFFAEFTTYFGDYTYVDTSNNNIRKETFHIQMFPNTIKGDVTGPFADKGPYGQTAIIHKSDSNFFDDMMLVEEFFRFVQDSSANSMEATYSTVLTIDETIENSLELKKLK